MSKMIVEKNKTHRKFVSPSAASDVTKKVEATVPKLSWKAQAGLGAVVGLWALRRFPKTTLLAAVVFGVYKGLNRKEAGNKNPFQGEGIVKDLLH